MFDLLFIYSMYTQMYSMEAMTVRETFLIEIKKCHKSIERNFTVNDEQDFAFFVLIKFYLSA